MCRCWICLTPLTKLSNLAPNSELRQGRQPESTASYWSCTESKQVEIPNHPPCSRSPRISNSHLQNAASSTKIRPWSWRGVTSLSMTPTKKIKLQLAAAQRRTMTRINWIKCRLKDSPKKIHRNIFLKTSKRPKRPKSYRKPLGQDWRGTHRTQVWPKNQNWKLEAKATNWTRIERQFWKPNWKSHQ